MRNCLLTCISMIVALVAGASLAQADPLCRMGTPGETAPLSLSDGRVVQLHLPREATGRLPLVFVLHGSGSSAKGVLADSKLAAEADASGFALVAPDAAIPLGDGYAWNIPGVPTVSGKVPGPEVPDDVAHILTTIDTLVEAGCVDPARVYVTGISGGGRMTSWLGCVAADRFAAIAPVVGLRAGNPLESDPTRPDPATCRPDAPLSVLAFAGDKDTVNPVEGGGAGYWQYSMDAALARWAALDGCTEGPRRFDFTGKLLVTAYGECQDGTSVTGWVYHGRGHEWVADNHAMWRFFERHHR